MFVDFYYFIYHGPIAVTIIFYSPQKSMYFSSKFTYIYVQVCKLVNELFRFSTMLRIAFYKCNKPRLEFRPIRIWPIFSQFDFSIFNQWITLSEHRHFSPQRNWNFSLCTPSKAVELNNMSNCGGGGGINHFVTI